VALSLTAKMRLTNLGVNMHKLTKMEVADKYICNMIDVHELPLNEHQIDFWAGEISRYPQMVVEQAWLEIMSSIRPKWIPSLSDVLKILDRYEEKLRTSLYRQEKNSEKKMIEDTLKSDPERSSDWSSFLKITLQGYDDIKNQRISTNNYYNNVGEFFESIGMKADAKHMKQRASKLEVVPIPTLPPLKLVD